MSQKYQKQSLAAKKKSFATFFYITLLSADPCKRRVNFCDQNWWCWAALASREKNGKQESKSYKATRLSLFRRNIASRSAFKDTHKPDHNSLRSALHLVRRLSFVFARLTVHPTHISHMEAPLALSPLNLKYLRKMVCFRRARDGAELIVQCNSGRGVE